MTDRVPAVPTHPLPQTLVDAARAFDPQTARPFEHEAEQQRQATVERFPRDAWPTMGLMDYVQGQDEVSDNYCWWVEHNALAMGSIRGGSARKLIIYKRRNEEGFYFPPGYSDVTAAWEDVRGAYVEAFGLAERGDWSAIDAIEALRPGPALVVKTLYAYFPEEVLPICASSQLRHFLTVAGRNDLAADHSLGAVALNRALHARLREVPELASLSTKALERFLYWRFSPFSGRMFKIAPGENARLWDECLAEEMICVGWDPIGDLRQFDTYEAFFSAFQDAYRERHNASKLTEKARELWSLLDIGDGEMVAANRGTSEILALGKVVSPGYVYDSSRDSYRHTLRLDWDTSYAQKIPAQGHWAFKTIKEIGGSLREQILVLHAEPPVNGDGGDERSPGPGSPQLTTIGEALERKGQAILYGPPGTGKTWTTRSFARWWLGTTALKDCDRLEWITFHPSYSYEDFVEGLRPAIGQAGALQLEDGLFKRFCDKARAQPDHRFLLVIDEINRGNIAKILGELITLLEVDKRDDISVRLPYSRTSFTVPRNVYVLGTMNTADRSIRLLDTALRRRFAFIELLPDPSVLEGGSVEGLALDRLLGELNRRIAQYVDRDKQIGHALLLRDEQPLTDAAEFARVMRQDVVPLLSEYAFDDYNLLADLVGDGLVDRDGRVVRTDVLADPTLLIEALEAEFSPSNEIASE
jgi:5-methylcytosine-specific restriction protein B